MFGCRRAPGSERDRARPQRAASVFTTRDGAIARAVGATIHDVGEALTLVQALAVLARWTDTSFDQLPSRGTTICLPGRAAGTGRRPRWRNGQESARPPGKWGTPGTRKRGRRCFACYRAPTSTPSPQRVRAGRLPTASVLASVGVSIADLPPVEQDRGPRARRVRRTRKRSAETTNPIEYDLRHRSA